ncbi:hypothetical protein SSP24_47320 [Streptomyces spinoverrucosus]|uniref:Major facilitator superfamily (MFS) profile domain-containing protein n=1 Tax=Streptomyces spinoverrucosus TaxID=284043 RepID=A0A4Y3VJP1_9ACTN|nr:hypothetical protein [Streptomyces spinoverrucosus]GEC07077.1 hypothetical protein SSP24_47320 [Streptomyces spinoverrucosus]GHB92233.1 hypothetical protein GCM10010397_75770 [Streptomyces spinoverrucosus]
MAGFVFWQCRNRREPLLPLRLFRSRGFSAASGAGAALGCAMSGLFLLPMAMLLLGLLCCAIESEPGGAAAGSPT